MRRSRALHLTTGPARTRPAEVREQVVLARELDQLARARGRGPSRRDPGPGGSRAYVASLPRREPWRSGRSRPGATSCASSSCRGGSIVTSRNWVPPLISERTQVPGPQAEPVLRARRGRVLPRLARRRAGGPDQRPRRPQPATSSRTTTGACSASSSARTTPRSADALLDARPRQWLRERGRDRMVGPMDFTTNDECGLLVEGYERKPLILQGWHHPYYRELLEGCGPDEGDGPLHVGAAARQGRGEGRLPPDDPGRGREGREPSTA